MYCNFRASIKPTKQNYIKSMKLHFITSHIVTFLVYEMIVTIILAMWLRSYKAEKPTEQERSEDQIGVTVMLQVLGILFMFLSIVSPFLLHFTFNNGLIGAIIIVPFLLLSAYLSGRVITPRILKRISIATNH